MLSSLCDAQHQKYTHEGPTFFPLISYYFLLLHAATVLRCYLLLCATICCCLPKPTKTNQKPATTTPAATSHNQPKPAKNQLKPTEPSQNHPSQPKPPKTCYLLLFPIIQQQPQQNIRKKLSIEPKNHAQINCKSTANHCKSKSCFSMLFGTLISFACFFESRPDRPERSQNA